MKRRSVPSHIRVFIPVAAAAVLALGLTALAAGARQDAAALRAADPPEGGLWLESLDLGFMSQDYGRPRARRTVDNQPLRLKGVIYPHGIGTHARSEWDVDLKGAARRF